MDYKKSFFKSMIQFVDFKIDMLEADRKVKEKVIVVLNKILKFQFLVPLIVSVVGYLVGIISNVNNFNNVALSMAFSGLMGTIPVILITTLCCVVAKVIYTKKVKDIIEEINMSLEVRKKFEEEILKVDEKNKNSSLEKNITVSVNDYQRIIDETDENIKEERKVKKLTLRKR